MQTHRWIIEWLSSRWTRHLLALTVIVSAWSLHLISNHPIQTPISEELARKNPIAVVFMAGLICLVIHMMHAALEGRMKFQGWSLFPIIPALTAIAFTSPNSGMHIQIFAGVALYGFAWLSLFAYMQGNRFITFFTGILFIVSVVCLIVFFVVGSILPWTAYELSPLGFFQKTFICIFAFFSISTV